MDVANITAKLQRVFFGSEKTPQALSTQRPNIPLPRELRDQIFGYLLRHEWTRDGPSRVGSQQHLSADSDEYAKAHTLAYGFHFHTSILAVNREINKEASQVLYSNHFVIVSHQWPRIATAKYIHDLPIITEDPRRVKAFTKHVLRVHIRAPTKLLGKNAKIQSFVMVADDLPILCECVQWIFYTLWSPAHFAFRLNRSPLHSHHEIGNASTENGKVVHTKMQFISSDMTKRKPELARALVEPFLRMLCGEQKVTILNYDSKIPAFDVDELKTTMGPHLVFFKAMAWHMYDTARNLKDKADAILQANNPSTYEAALQKYQNLWKVYELCPLFKLESKVMDSDVAIPVGLLSFLLRDAIISYVDLVMKLGRELTQAPEIFIRQVTYVLSKLPPSVHTSLLLSAEMSIEARKFDWLMAVAALSGSGPRDPSVVHESKASYQQHVETISRTTSMR